MARADLLLELVRAGATADNQMFRKALEALIAEEKAKQHHVLADRLAAHLGAMDRSPQRPQRALFPSNGPQVVSEIRPRRKLDDLVIGDGVLESCTEFVEEHHRADLLRAHNLEPRHRVLLVGPPGNGKTTLAEALATALAVPLMVVRYEAIIGSYLGETAVRLAKLFQQVRQQRCVLFFDEFDVIGKERGDVHETGEIKRVVSSLLLQIDQLPSHVVVVTATNHSELLDRAVWRRFQLRLELPNPTAADRRAWFRLFEHRSGLKFEYTHDHLARKLKGLSFAELEQFGLDVQRRYVLALPSGDMRAIVSTRLKHWARRVQPTASTAGDVADA